MNAMNKLKNVFSYSLFFLSINFYAFPIYIKNEQTKEQEILETVLTILKNKHINSKKIDDDFSKKMFVSYIEYLDGFGYFFLESDIQEFKKYETELDDQILKNDLSFFYLTRDRYLQRARESKEIYTSLLKNKLNFSSLQNVETNKVFNFKNIFKKNKEELSEYYKNGLKSMVLDYVKLNYNPNFSTKEFDDFILETEANKLPKILEASAYNVDNISKEFVFRKYLNALISQYDNHSKYYLPYLRDEYVIKQTGKIEGIGVSMTIRDNFTQIDKLALGGPAYKTNKLAVGDVILKIAQENNQPINITGLSLYDVAKLTRGKSGTNIKLTIKKPNGTIEIVPIKRGIVSRNDSYIKSCIVNKNKIKYGVLSFQRFYDELDEEENRNATEDFEKELTVLNQSEIEGLILDIRNNSGGTLESAVKILGNFITKNDVTQFKDNDNKVLVIKSENEDKKWKKNIVLLVNSKTESAAEMFAAAFKEQNLGVIIGENTYGNATIQEFLDLNLFKKNTTNIIDFGSLQITTESFYNLNGKSIHNSGIIPDINFSLKNTVSNPDKNLNALNIISIKGINFKTENKQNNFLKIIENRKAILNKNKIYNYIINDNFEENLKNITNLNKEKFRKSLDNLLEKQKLSPLINYSNNLEFLPTQNDEKTFKKREYLLQKRKDWYKSLSQDFIIDEGLNILEDMNSIK